MQENTMWSIVAVALCCLFMVVARGDNKLAIERLKTQQACYEAAKTNQNITCKEK